MGDIGYLCEHEDELLEVVTSLARSPPRDRYNAQCRNIQAGRTMFGPEQVARDLQAIAALPDC
jgi:hypothetical protein